MMRNKGFTIVELLIVIVVIGILAAITIVAFNGVQARATFAKHQSQLSTINKAIQLYYADNGTYPYPGDTVYYQDQHPTTFLAVLVPKYLASLPSDGDASGSFENSYLYRPNSSGSEYKLLRHTRVEDGGLPLAERGSSLADPRRATWAWGYWSSSSARDTL